MIRYIFFGLKLELEGPYPKIIKVSWTVRSLILDRKLLQHWQLYLSSTTPFDTIYRAPLSKNQEVSAFGNDGAGDDMDVWTVVCNYGTVI